MKIARPLALVLLVLVAVPIEAPGGGVPRPEPVFTFVKTPEISGFLEGRLGVLLPTFQRRYHVISYRYLTGVPLTRGEIAPWAPLRRTPAGIPSEAWLKSRGRVQTSRPTYLNPYRSADGYQFYENCPADAFLTAALTLNARIASFGVRHPGVKAWVEAQDAVFANCSKGKTIPAAAGNNLPAIFRADRDYQIAAAYFYSEDFGEAYGRFREIAADRQSPWSPIAPYLAARCLVRESTLRKAGKLEQAVRELDEILARRPGPDLDAARRLREFALLRARTQEAADEIVRELPEPRNGSLFFERIAALDWALDHGAIAGGDLGDWLSWMKIPSHEIAVGKWRAGGGLQWLVAALMSAKIGDPAQRELSAAAEAVPENSPAFATLFYHRIRLLDEDGKRERARAELDRTLPAIRKTLPVSSVNMFLARRMAFARSFEEFLRFAPRGPAEIHYAAQGTQPGVKMLLDADSLAILNKSLPLRSLEAAAASRLVPPEAATRILMLTFTRAIVLERLDVAVRLAPELAARRPVLGDLLQRIRTAANDEERSFAAAYTLLRSPGLSPWLDTALPARDEVRLDRRDIFRRNWWYGGQLRAAPAWFLNADERAEWESDWDTLRWLEPGPTWIGKRVAAWAEAHPEDPRSPESLYLTVRATRYSPGNGAISKAAFTALHAGWPKSEWAAKTPHWFP